MFPAQLPAGMFDPFVQDVLNILIGSWREGFVQVSGFVGATILLFSLVQYRFDGKITRWLEANERAQPLAGALLGLTPGCGGAIIAMPLYIRGTVSFGTVVAALGATAGDSAFIILALAPEAALYAYGMAFVASVLFGYAIDLWGLGVGQVDRAVERMSYPVTDGGFATTSVADGGPSIPDYERPEDPGHDHGRDLPGYLPASPTRTGQSRDPRPVVGRLGRRSRGGCDVSGSRCSRAGLGGRADVRRAVHRGRPRRDDAVLLPLLRRPALHRRGGCWSGPGLLRQPL